MKARIQIVIDRQEKERLQRQAANEGTSLSDWIRAAARERLAAAEERPRLDTRKELEEFFTACDARESGRREPDWSEHLQVIDASRSAGLPPP